MNRGTAAPQSDGAEGKTRSTEGHAFHRGGQVSSVEALARWLNERPRDESDGSFTSETRVRLGREANRRLLYLSRRFGVPKEDLAGWLVRSAIKDVFDAIPGDPLPHRMIPDLHDAGVDPETYRWFDLDGVEADELLEELTGSSEGAAGR